MPPPQRPAEPDDATRRPSCRCGGKRSLALPGDRRIFVCPLCDFADSPVAGGCFGPVHPG
jgi:hypothetical protein